MVCRGQGFAGLLVSRLHATLTGVSRVFLFVRCGVRVMVFDRSLKRIPFCFSIRRTAVRGFNRKISSGSCQCRTGWPVSSAVWYDEASAWRTSEATQWRAEGEEENNWNIYKRGRKSNLEFGSSGQLQPIHQKSKMSGIRFLGQLKAALATKALFIAVTGLQSHRLLVD